VNIPKNFMESSVFDWNFSESYAKPLESVLTPSYEQSDLLWTTGQALDHGASGASSARRNVIQILQALSQFLS
jgi:hypothetical protein